MECPGSIRLSDKMPEQKPKEYTAEGTAAHKLAEQCLRLEMDAKDFLGNTIEADGFSFEVTKEMATAVQVYLDTVRSIQAKYPERIRLDIEAKITLEWVHKDIAGTADAILFDAVNCELWVIDYKHGVGTEVFAENNTQAKIYALGAMLKVWLQQTDKTRKALSPMQIIRTVHVVIVQPRLRGTEEFVKEWETTSDYLQFWAWMILQPKANECDEDEAYLHVNAGCKWCPALAVCPTQVKHACELAKAAFEDPIFAEVGSLTPDEVGKVMDFQAQFKPWSDAVKEYGENAIRLGQDIPGYKLVKGRKNRKWKNEHEAEGYLVPILGAEANTTKLVTVKQAEDALKKKKCLADDFNNLWDKEEAGLVIVPESDPRQAEAHGAIGDFAADLDILS